VASLVVENGGDEDQAIAALLHDAAEDQGGLETLDLIRNHFGERVAAIVAGCSDTFQTPKPPWRIRKEIYLAELRTAEPAIVLVSLADKLHNARSLLVVYRNKGDRVWERFNGGKEGMLWYYRSLVEIFQEKSDSQMVDELKKIFSEIELLAKGSITDKYNNEPD
jgi:GTP pyrophosphokinase